MPALRDIYLPLMTIIALVALTGVLPISTTAEDFDPHEAERKHIAIAVAAVTVIAMALAVTDGLLDVAKDLNVSIVLMR